MDVVNYALSKKLNWDNIKNKPFYDNTSTKTCSQTVWYGGYLSNVDDWTEIDNDLWQLLLTKNITLSSKLGDFIYVNEHDDTVEYLVSEFIRLNVSKTTNKAYIMGSAPGGTHIDDIELTYEVTTEDIKKIDPKFLPEIPRSIMIINITRNDDGTYSADKTFDEISEFYNNRGSVYVYLQGNDILMPLTSINFDLGISVFSIFVPIDNIVIGNFVLFIDTNNNISSKDNVYYTLPEPNAGDENRFLKGDGTWSELPLSFNDAGELEVTLNGVTKTFVPKG